MADVDVINHVSLNCLMFSAGTDCQHSMQNVAHTLKDLERVVLTWPPSSRTEHVHLRDSMTESLKSMSSHLQMGDEWTSDDGDEEGECNLGHAFLSEENDASVSFDEMVSDDGGEDDERDLSHESFSEENDVSVRFFGSVFRVVSSNITAYVFRRRKCWTKKKF